MMTHGPHRPKLSLPTSYWMIPALCLSIFGLFSSTASAEDKKPAEEPKLVKDKDGWISLFDGKTLKGWKITNFGGQGDVIVKDGAILMEVGSNLTGIHTERKLPKINYEVQLEAQRVNGSDFFCGLTFPVKKESMQSDLRRLGRRRVRAVEHR